jgi:hypothetical protein
VVLQVTPVVAIAPLILIWVGFERINLALRHYRHHRCPSFQFWRARRWD